MPSEATSCDGRPQTSRSRKRMLPRLGLMTPVRQLKRVVLPAPFGPMMLRIEPPSTEKLTPSTALRPAKCFVSALTSSIGISEVREEPLGPVEHEHYQPDPDEEH